MYKCYLGIFFCIVAVLGEENDTLEEGQSYCFRFTWVGPEYNKENYQNTTCGEYLDSTRAYGIPCRQPLVVTTDGTPPDLNYLYEYHKGSVLCRRGPSQVCARYSYSFANAVENVTYMCTKLSVDGDIENKGCYKQIVDGHEVELCFCKWGSDGFKPCNALASSHLISTYMIIALIFIGIKQLLNRYL